MGRVAVGSDAGAGGRPAMVGACHPDGSDWMGQGAWHSRYIYIQTGPSAQLPDWDGSMIGRQVFASLAGVVTGALVVTSCTGGGGKPSGTTDSGTSAATSSTSLSPTRSSTSASSTASASRSGAPTGTDAAVAAYRQFTTANYAAYRKPGDQRLRVRLTAYAFDPSRGTQLGYLVSLVQQGVAWRGTPPQPRVSVQSTDLHATPWPSVTLVDCPTPAPSWREYVVKTGAIVPRAPGQESPPFKITVQVIYYKGHWGVRKTTPDTSRTCTV